jgi:uncharacterized damage-inducible protein DinB
MTSSAARPAPDEYAPYYQGYVDKVPAGDIVATLEAERDATLALFATIAEETGAHRYAEGKWSVKELMGHINDTERVFAYRLMRIARGDETPIEGFNQDPYIPTGRFNERTVADLAAEFEHIRAATLDIARNLDDEAWSRAGTANGLRVTARALGYILAGHARHHADILRERYLTR